jgi:galactose mutarotase-like enzyme
MAGPDLGNCKRVVRGCDGGVGVANLSTTETQSENVLIQLGECAVTVFPQFGGKIASIRIGDVELLQAPLAPVAPRSRAMGFEESDASGWDECFPSVAGCRVQTDRGVAEIPDHGDLWRVKWEEQGSAIGRQGFTDGDHVSSTLVGRCFSVPLELERTLALTETNRGWLLKLQYKVRNTGQYPVPWSWAAHPLFVVEQGDRIVLPETIRRVRVEGSRGGRLGKYGDEVAWPIATLADAGSVDLSVAEAGDSGIGDKLFAGPLGAAENWCVLERRSVGLHIRVRFNSVATPYLGLWLCYGGWPEREGPKQVCAAIEPTTAPVDSLAVQGGWSRALAAGETFSWPMEVEIERIER